MLIRNVQQPVLAKTSLNQIPCNGRNLGLARLLPGEFDRPSSAPQARHAVAT